MASKTARPGRRLIIFALVVAALYGGVALAGEWKPKLGLDLQGGQRITLEARTDNGQKPSAASLEEARGNYKIVARLFNMEAGDYKRFLNFLRKHDCQIPFKEYR